MSLIQQTQELFGHANIISVMLVCKQALYMIKEKKKKRCMDNVPQAVYQQTGTEFLRKKCYYATWKRVPILWHITSMDLSGFTPSVASRRVGSKCFNDFFMTSVSPSFVLVFVTDLIVSWKL